MSLIRSIFIISISLSILLMAHSPVGMEEINRLLSSTIIGATITDVWVFAVMVIMTATTLFFYYRRALLLVMDPEMARAVGLPVDLCNRLISIWLGLAIGFSIHVSGVVFGFASLVLPALVAKNVCQQIRHLFLVAPAVSFGTGIIAFVLANEYDYPPGQLAAACLSLLLVFAWVLRGLRVG